MKKFLKNNICTVLFIIILIIAIIVLVVVAKKSNTGEIKTIENSSSMVEEEEPEKKETKTKPKCTGTYYGEYANGTRRNSINLKYTYILNEDGTYSFNNGSTTTTGVFVINDNTISLIGKKETSTPGDDTTYKTSDFLIANDCSYIRYNDGTNIFNLNKQS